MGADQPELIADYACVVGEGPLWHPLEQRVYWTDIETGRLFRYHPASGVHEQCYAGERVGGFTVQADGGLLLFMARGAIKLWREGAFTTVVDEIPEEREGRFNDVIADPAGRVFCGTMPIGQRLGRLYRLDTDGTLTTLLDHVNISNGLGFTPDRRGLYYTESMAYKIYLFDYDAATGAISNRRVFAENKPEDGIPDGMTVDAEGCVWSARWDGNRLVRYRADGSLDCEIHFPVPKVSSVIFGGPNYEEMYVTTAGGDQKATNGEYAGALFRLRPGVRGAPEFFSRIKS